jgi:regulator of replication initiation timing
MKDIMNGLGDKESFDITKLFSEDRKVAESDSQPQEFSEESTEKDFLKQLVENDPTGSEYNINFDGDNKQSQEHEADPPNQEDEPQRKKRQRNPATRQINNLTKKNSELLRHNQYLALETERYKAQLESQQEYSKQVYSEHVKSTLNNYKEALAQAYDNGDGREIAELQHKIAEYSTKLENSKNISFEQNRDRGYDNYRPEPAQENYEEEAADDNPYFQNFLDKCRWADPNSEDYDQDLDMEATEVAKKLAKAYKFKGKSIKSKAFYDDLYTRLDNMYGLEEENTSFEPRGNNRQDIEPTFEPRKQQNKPSYNMPVNRATSTMDASSVYNMKLTAYEKEIALATNFNTHKHDGSPLTDAEKILRFKIAKLNRERMDRS